MDGGQSKGEHLDVVGSTLELRRGWGGGLEWTRRGREDGVMIWEETEMAQKGA